MAKPLCVVCLCVSVRGGAPWSCEGDGVLGKDGPVDPVRSKSTPGLLGLKQGMCVYLALQTHIHTSEYYLHTDLQ